jgi:hypothetical protein
VASIVNTNNTTGYDSTYDDADISQVVVMMTAVVEHLYLTLIIKQFSTLRSDVFSTFNFVALIAMPEVAVEGSRFERFILRRVLHQKIKKMIGKRRLEL